MTRNGRTDLSHLSDEEKRERKRKYQSKWKMDHPEYMVTWRKENRERVHELTRKNYDEQVALDPKYNRRRNLKKFGLTLEQYDTMVEAQKGLCAICDQPAIDSREGWSGLHVDHDYRLGKKEGRRLLLCSNCNTALGLFKENVTTLENAIAYLEFFKVKE